MGTKYSEGKAYKVIAYVHACFLSDDQQEMIRVITRKSREHNCKVIFFSTLASFYEENLDSGEIRIFDTVSVEKFDAIVLMAETFKSSVGQEKFVQRATAAGVPVIAVDHYVPGCINISFDYKEAFREIVKHMVEYHGYRNINFMAGIRKNSFSEERIGVFKDVLSENNIPFQPEKIYYGDFWEVPTAEAMKKMIEEDKNLPEAIICANDTMALTVCDYLRKQGIRVPEDVAVSGFDGLEAGIYHQPRLLTSVYDPDAFANALFRFVNGEECVVGEKSRFVSAYNQIQIGGSCGCKSVEGMDASVKIIHIKSDMNVQMDYQTNLARMVAKYGNGDGMEIIQKVIPKQLSYMHYHDFWFCSEKRLLITDYPSYGGEKQVTNGLYNAIHYTKEESVSVTYEEKYALPKLVPDLERYLEMEYPLLVVNIPSKDDPNAYAVINMDVEKFRYTAYSSFIYHLRFLLDMQHSKKKLMQVYRMDLLTGLLNRNGFYFTMDQIMKYSAASELTVISLDMCKFKEINDAYGHAEGDQALCEVGKFIKSSISGRDIAARIGGDEFLIILFREDQKERAEEIIASLQRKAEEFNKNNEKDYKLIFSIGVCSEKVGDHSLDYFLKEADQKMYAHKREQKLGR